MCDRQNKWKILILVEFEVFIKMWNCNETSKIIFICKFFWEEYLFFVHENFVLFMQTLSVMIYVNVWLSVGEKTSDV